MHQHIGATRGCHQLEHGRIPQAAGAAHIVHPVSARRQGRLGHGGEEGIHRQQNLRAGGTDRPERRQQTIQFRGSANLGSAGAGALGPEIQHISPGCHHAPGLRQGLLRPLEAAAITEGIGGEVDHPHHQGALAPAQAHQAATGTW